MSPGSRLATPVVLWLGLVGRLPAQEVHQRHGETIGRVVFPVSCTPEARTRFERAVALLHSFWYERAADTFREAVVADTACAMGYWGQAMSLFHPLWTPPTGADLAAGLAASERGLALVRTPRERDYLTAIRTYYADYGQRDHTTRLAVYAEAMDGVRRRHPRDREAAIFYALSLIALAQANATDTTFSYQKRADAILEPLFKAEPRHPGLAPDVPHAQHMPSHIFTRLGLWDDDIASNIRSAASARTFEDERHLDALWDQRGHAWDYLVYAYLQQGRDAEAKRVVDEAAAVTAVYPVVSLTNAYALAAIPARHALERGRWREATTLAVRPSPEWRAAEALTHFAHALGAARTGDTAGARSAISALDDIERTERAAGGAHAYWAGQVRIQRLAASGWLARTKGDTAEAVRLATTAADLEDVTQKHPVTPGSLLPARELLGDLLLELGRPVEAAQAYAASLAQQPNRARSLFGLARASEQAGDLATARTRYREYLALMQQGDGARAELEIARGALSGR